MSRFVTCASFDAAKHKMIELQVKTEMSALPLDWVPTIEVLPRQHIIVFRKRPLNLSY